MAKKNGSRRRKRNGFTIPVGIVAPLGQSVIYAWANGQDSPNPLLGSFKYWLASMTGYLYRTDQPLNFESKFLAQGLIPLAIGTVFHKIVGQRLGVNRMLASNGVPIIRL